MKAKGRLINVIKLMEQVQQQNQHKIPTIRASDTDLKGVYSNVMQVNHGKEEFILSFFSIFGMQGSLVSRVIISPGHLKRMIGALQDNLKKYESKFEPVEIAEEPKQEMGF